MAEQKLPWREEYRPQTLKDLVGLDSLKRDIDSWGSGHPAGLLFVGPPGTGKTTAAGVIARILLGESNFNDMNFVEYNASDDRGIDFIRNDLKQMARLKPVGTTHKVILLDEADGLTKQAQEALRRTMEKHSSTTVFILTANSKPSIIPAIQSRCVTYDFVPYSEAEVAEFVGMVKERTGFPSEWCESYDLLCSATGGDLRQCIDLLQSTVKEPSALAERLIGLSRDLSNPALSIAAGDYDSLRVELKRLAEGGLSNLEMLRRLHQFVRTLGMDAEQFTSYSAVWGDFVMKATLWPLDSDGFIDYFVASLRAAVKNKTKQEIEKNDWK